jgi:hypothetical protein
VLVAAVDRQVDCVAGGPADGRAVGERAVLSEAERPQITTGPFRSAASRTRSSRSSRADFSEPSGRYVGTVRGRSSEALRALAL